MARDRGSQNTLSHSTVHVATSMRLAKDAEQTKATTPPSAVKANAAREVESGQYPIPQIQGVVPGICRARQLTSSLHAVAHSLIPTASDVLVANGPCPIQYGTTIFPRKNTTALKITYSITSPRSNYPRVSPPCFLYPVPIVPYTFPPAQPSTTATTQTLCACTETPQQSVPTLITSPMQQSDAPLAASLPTSLKVIFLITLAVIVLVVIWSVLTFCISFPPGSWKVFRRGQPSGETSNGVERTAAQGNGVELHNLNNNRLNAQSSHIQPPSVSTRRHRYTPQDNDPFSPRPAPSVAALSPYNPFLDPPAARVAGVQRPRRAYKVRSSREWKEAHAAFFGGAGDTTKSSTAEVSKAAERKGDGTEVVGEGSAAAEEQKENGRGDKESKEDALVNKGVKWVGQGLDMLDDAVDEAATGIARWTEEKKSD